MQESSMLKKRLRVFESIYSEREKITTSTPKVNPFDFDLFSGEINSEFEHISPLKSLKISLSESPLSNVFRSLPLYIDKQEEMDSNVIVISLPYLISAEIVVQYLIIYGEVESLDTCHNKQNGTEIVVKYYDLRCAKQAFNEIRFNFNRLCNIFEKEKFSVSFKSNFKEILLKFYLRIIFPIKDSNCLINFLKDNREVDSIYVNREGVDITVKFSNSRAQYATWFILRKLSHHERLTVKENFLSELNLLYKREKSSAMIETKEKSLKLSSLSINFSTPQNIILPLSSSIFSNNKENLPVSTKNLANTVTNFRNTENNHEVSFFSKQKYKVVFDQKYSGIKKRNTPDEERKKYIINIANILNDCDNRTTVMIKNIPNHITQDNIIAMFNRNYSKTYNFFYLPIDFNKMANAGYAFINFKRNKYIIDFFLEFDNKPWTFPGCEDKLCYISYARIQGFKAICDHFHKSNIMKQVDQKLKPIIINN